MKITFGNNFIPQLPVSDTTKPQQSPLFTARKPSAETAKDKFVRSIQFGNEFLDPDLDDFLDMIDTDEAPDHLLDKIVRGRQKVNEDGSISFPVNRIPRPNFNYQPNPPYDPTKDPGDEGDGDPQPGPGQPGPGQPGPGQPTPGTGPGGPGDEVGEGEGEGEGGEQAGEGEGDYGREYWSAPYSPSDIAKLMGKSWGLPFIEDRGKGEMKQQYETFDSKRSTPPGKVLIRPTMRNAAGREMALIDFDNANLERPLKKFEPKLKEFEKAVSAKNASAGMSEELLAIVGAFTEVVEQFEKTAFPVVEAARDKDFDAALQAFKGALKTSVGTPEFTKTALPAFKKALKTIKDREFGQGENIFVNESRDVKRISTRVQTKPHTQAVIFYIMDVSGSISNDMKQMARTNNFLLSTWLKYQYGLLAAKSQGKKYSDKDFFGKGVHERYVIHTDGAKEVTAEEFYTTRQSGGTTISSAYEKVKEIIEEEYPPEKWNIYIFQYSDGDSWGDNQKSGDLIEELMGKYDANLLGYCNLRDPRWGWFGSDNFDSYLKSRFGDHPRIRRAALSHNSLDVYKKAISTLLEPADKGGKKA